MGNRILFLILTVLFTGGVAAQVVVKGNRSWKWQSFGTSALKLVYQPEGNWLQTNLSDAVIAKPDKQVLGWELHVDTVTTNIAVLFPDSVSLELARDDTGSLKGFRIRLEPGERLYGGGERAIDLNRRGYRLPLYNEPSYGYQEGAVALNYSVPVFFSSRGYAVFFDNPSRGYADLGKSDSSWMEVSFTGGELNVYLITGATLDEQLRHFTELTGRQPLPPRWTFGNFMSRFGYTSQEQVLDILERTQAARIPTDAVIFDLFWFGDKIQGTLGNFDWINRQHWPDPKGMMDSLANRKIKTILISEPFFLEGTKYYPESLPFLAVDNNGKPYTLQDLYFGKGGLLDLFRNDAQSWFWKLYDKQIRLGVDGWWGDLGEPEKHPADMFHKISIGGKTTSVSADVVHNIYGHTWSKFLAGYYLKNYPGQRLFYLNRSGFAGTPRYGIFPWTGDVSRSWSGLRAQLSLLQGMSISGVPYIHSDAGGFAGGDGDAELYLRWLQFAAFTPVFRPHGTMVGNIDPGAASYPSEPVEWPDSIRDAARRIIQIRYDLLPYNYSLAFDQTTIGKPLIRPMNYYSFADSNLQRSTDQYMWGDQLLVAPIVEKGATTRKLWLPEGDWFSFWTNRRIPGGASLDEPVQWDRIPVFVKAGSFIPTRPGLRNTDDYKTRFLLVKYYQDEHPSSYTLFDDDGKNPQSLSTGNFERINFSAKTVKNVQQIIVGTDNVGYVGKVIKKVIVLEIISNAGNPKQIRLDNMIVPVRSKFEESELGKGSGSIWDPINNTLRVYFEYTGKPQVLSLSY
ncbi:glycoside hydrolase family 31 protein [Flavihumibacter petaseus]|uniref:Putative alpha-glucosidase n=1 Tax=Flavihumibacter petaseus NBRC 106054 TaxID=1220578 RepID=A0A0E9MVT8_9BACT|nr:TIM-barrel domain-containing protein [Flavihumibacter petaseus]GAO41608.1 putative alpha-glucosidase [Flavihumibacter petaseus NBRC 106054]